MDGSRHSSERGGMGVGQRVRGPRGGVNQRSNKRLSRLSPNRVDNTLSRHGTPPVVGSRLQAIGINDMLQH
jgi:hypothetical protein